MDVQTSKEPQQLDDISHLYYNAEIRIKFIL